MANQNGSVNGSVVEVSEATELFRQFLAQSNMSLDDNGVIMKDETVGEAVDVWFDKVIENVQEEIDTAGMNDDMEVEMEAMVKRYGIYNSKKGAKIGVLETALKSDAPIIEYILRNKVTNKGLMQALEDVGFKFTYKYHDETGAPVRLMERKGFPTRYAAMGSWNKQLQCKGSKSFTLA